MFLEVLFICSHITTLGAVVIILYYLFKAKNIINNIKHKLKAMDINVDELFDELYETKPTVIEPKTRKKVITAVGPNKAVDSMVSPESIAIYKQRLAELISSGNSKNYLGKQIILEQLGVMADTEIDKMHSIYQAKLGLKMTKSLGQSIINLYTATVSHLFTIDNSEKLAHDLGEDPIITSSLSSITSYLYFAYGSLLAPVAASIITFSHIKNSKKNNNNIEPNGTECNYSGTECSYSGTNSNTTTITNSNCSEIGI